MFKKIKSRVRNHFDLSFAKKVVLVKVCILAMQASADTNDLEWVDSGEVYRTIARQGYGGMKHIVLSVGPDFCLPASPRASLLSVSNIVTGLGQSNFQGLVEREFRRKGATNTVPKCKIFVSLPTNNLELFIAHSKELPNAQFHRLTSLVEVYLRLRFDGHSETYALDAIRYTQDAPTNGGSVSVEAFMADTHGIPPKWLRRSTNDNSYYVVDGPIAWWYPRDEEVEKRDAREFEPKFKAKLDAVMKEVSKNGTAPGKMYWDEVKRLLKRDYGIDWLNPMDLNETWNIGP